MISVDILVDRSRFSNFVLVFYTSWLIYINWDSSAWSFGLSGFTTSYHLLLHDSPQTDAHLCTCLHPCSVQTAFTVVLISILSYSLLTLSWTYLSYTLRLHLDTSFPPSFHPFLVGYPWIPLTVRYMFLFLSLYPTLAFLSLIQCYIPQYCTLTPSRGLFCKLLCVPTSDGTMKKKNHQVHSVQWLALRRAFNPRDLANCRHWWPV